MYLVIHKKKEKKRRLFNLLMICVNIQFAVIVLQLLLFYIVKCVIQMLNTQKGKEGVRLDG